MSPNVVRSWFNGNAIVTSLIPEIGQFDVVRVHSVKSIGVLDPVRSIWYVYGGRIGEHIVEPHISTVHDVDCPERRILYRDLISRKFC